MKKIISLISIALISVVFLTGCATNISSPIRSYSTKVPTIHIVQQGSIPATSIYRQNFIVISTNANARAFFTPEIVAQIVAGGLTVITDITDKSTERYYDMLKNNYRWRTDVFMSGMTNFTDAQIIAILEAGTKPQFDGQRSPVIQRSFKSLK